MQAWQVVQPRMSRVRSTPRRRLQMVATLHLRRRRAAAAHNPGTPRDQAQSAWRLDSRTGGSSRCTSERERAASPRKESVLFTRLEVKARRRKDCAK